MCAIPDTLFGQDSIIVRNLANQGFENVRISHFNDTTYINVENNSYRWNIDTFSKVWSQINETLGLASTVVLSLSELNQPKLFFTFDKLKTDRGKYQLQTISDHSVFYHHIQSKGVTCNSGKNRLSIFLLPEVSASHSPLNKFYGQICFSPVFESSFWNGGKLLVQPRFQILNTDRYEGQTVSPGYFTIEQHFKIKNIHNQIIAGYFNSSRYGAQLSMKRYFYQGKYTVSAKIAYTGELYFDGFTPYHTSLSTLTYAVAGQYFFSPYKMQLQYELERTLNGTLGHSFSFHRFFNETVVGFYATLFKGKSIAGFYVDIPLCKKHKSSASKQIRLQLPNYWGLSYIGKFEAGYGSRLVTSPLSTVTWKNYNPTYFNYFLKN